MAETNPTGKKKEILEHPENWNDMVKKYQEREEEQEKRLLEKRGVTNPEELVSVAKDTLAKKALRAEHQTLKDRKILTTARSDEVNELAAKLDKEIAEFARVAIQQVPSLKGHPALKGRVTAGSPEERLTGTGA